MKGKILMKVYIDFDDVLCETAKHFTKLAKELFGIDVPYREVQFFNLKKTFDPGALAANFLRSLRESVTKSLTPYS